MEINNQELIHEVNDTMEKAVAIFSGIAEGKINQVPFEKSWTAAQVMKHLVMSNGGFEEIMRGSVTDSGRDQAQNVALIQSIFLDFTTKMKSPGFIVPPDELYDKTALLTAFVDIKNKLVNNIDTQDLSKLCTAFKLPQLGFLTRLEAIHFVVCHTKRHTHQLQQIGEALTIPGKLAIGH